MKSDNTAPLTNEALGSDPMDRYSMPVSSHEIVAENDRVLGTLVTLVRRADPKKPGRTLSVGWDARQPLIPGFTNVYAYTMRFTVPTGGKGIPAGQHFHNEKNEIFRSIIGKFRVFLEDPENGNKTSLDLDSNATNENGEQIEQFVYVPTGVAHAVLPLSEGDSALEVIANHPNVARDELPYPMGI